MTNELASLFVLLIWLSRGSRFDLSFIVLTYYALYLITDSTLWGWCLFQGVQVIIDLVVILLCVTLAYKNYSLAHSCFLYSIIVFSSLCVEVSHLLYGAGFKSIWYELYSYRQEFSHTFDLIFALAGSGKRGLITDAYLFILHILRYTRDMWNKLNT